MSKYGSLLVAKLRLLDKNQPIPLTTAYDLDLDIDQVKLIS